MHGEGRSRPQTAESITKDHDEPNGHRERVGKDILTTIAATLHTLGKNDLRLV